MRHARTLTATLIALTLLLTPTVEAKGKKKKGPDCYSEFQGKIIFDSKPFPRKFRTGKKCVKYMTPRVKQDVFHRSPSFDWNLYMFIFFSEVIGNDEFAVHIYKITGESETFVTEEGYSIKPTLNTFFAEITLSEDEFEVGPQYEIRALRTVEGQEKVYAKKRFTLAEAKKKGKKRR